MVAGIYLFGISGASGYIWFAFVGAAAAAVVVYLIASIGRDGATPVMLALAGAALSAGLYSIMNVILVSSQDTLDRFRFWQVGGIAGSDWSVVLTGLPFLLIGALIVLGSGRILNSLALGDDVARGLGQNVTLARGVTALGIVLLCGSATALAGPIGFVGLVVPHAVRFFTGPDYRWILPFSMVLAPALLLVSDVIGRVVLLPGEVPAGIMTAILGAPSSCGSSAGARGRRCEPPQQDRTPGHRRHGPLCGDCAPWQLHGHHPRFLQDPHCPLDGRGEDPGRKLHRHGKQTAAGRAGNPDWSGVRPLGRALPDHAPQPLASPDVIGISYGASAAAVLAIVVFGASGAAVSAAALAGAIGVALVIYAISRGGSGSGGGSGGRRGNAAGNRLILAGVGVAAALGAVVNFLMTRADIRTASEALIWLNGSLNSANWERVGVLMASLAVLVPALALLAVPLRMLELGDDAAAGLGIRVNAVRFGLVITAVALAAMATAAAGPVAFVAFLAGPIARRVVGRPSLPASAFTGALIVLAADYFAYNVAPLVLAGTVLPVGVITGALGAPFLLWLLVTSNRKEA
ncbi:probable siderophore transport system permease protein YfiZ [Arthrobacter sp. Hiyo8]|nr:probable siderophore transport system permease protein YfiZ [Arthrobacter sp. Hiyo8]